MATIHLNQEKYYNGLTIMEKGFREDKETKCQQVESNLSSLNSLIETLELLNTTLLDYHIFLEDDIVKFRQIGNEMVEADATISQQIGGQL